MLKSFPLGGASHVLEEACFVSEGPWSSVRKGPRTEKRGPLGEAEAEAEMGSITLKRLCLGRIFDSLRPLV